MSIRKPDKRDKYTDRLSPRGITKRGRGNIGRDGPASGRVGNPLKNCGEYTDPKSAITEISHGVRIKGQICMGHYDVNGLPIEGPMKVNNMRIYDGSKLVGKLQFVALTFNLNDDDWLDENRALLYDEYINRQESAKIKRGSGFVYPESFFDKFKSYQQQK